MPYLDRTSFIELLERLGAEADADVLAAAREAHRRIKAAELDWDEVLVRAPGAAAVDRLEDYDDPDADVRDFEIRDVRGDHSFRDQDPVPPRLAALYAEELNVIDSLLARVNLSHETRHELLDLRADIAANEFQEMDRTYLRDLAARLDARSRDD